MYDYNKKAFGTPGIRYVGRKNYFGVPGVTYDGRNKALGIVVWV